MTDRVGQFGVHITSVNTSSVDAHFPDVISKEHISFLKYSNYTVPNIDE